MIVLIRENIERVAASEDAAVRLEKEGFVRITEPEKAKEEEVISNEQEDEQELEVMTVSELRNLAKEKGLSGVSALSKAELLEVLKDVM